MVRAKDIYQRDYLVANDRVQDLVPDAVKFLPVRHRSQRRPGTAIRMHGHGPRGTDGASWFKTMQAISAGPRASGQAVQGHRLTISTTSTPPDFQAGDWARIAENPDEPDMNPLLLRPL